MERPDANSARQAAPEWVREALKTINHLEFEIQFQRLHQPKE
jgi:hypothetical protein